MSSPVEPANDAEKVKILELAVKEMRLKYKRINIDYNNLGTKIFTLIGTELVITTFLFSLKLAANKPLFNLDNLALKIFFIVGVAAIFLAIGLLFWATTSNKWASPVELKELKSLNYRTYADLLEYSKNDYIETLEFCQPRYDQRADTFDASVLLFVIGAIILMVIKIGGLT